MRKTLLGLMLAVTTALPALATAQQAPDPAQQRSRGDWGGRRGYGGGGGGRDAQPQIQRAAEQQATQQGQRWGGGQWRRGADGQERTDRQAGFDRQQERQQRQPGSQGNWQHRDDRADRDGGRDFGRRGDTVRQWQRSFADRRDDLRDNNRFAERAQWNRNWRGSDRYDYRDYRSSNRGAFHLPRYYAPYGWDGGYRRFGVGIRLSSVLFGQNYWIDDPYDYRLPPAYGPYRWVRYYNDALLVDLRSGYVVDTVYDIFW